MIRISKKRKEMKVTLINYSQPSPSMAAQGCQTLLDMVAFCARVSNPDNQLAKETNERLVAYLMRNHHWSPVENVTICLEIETTRDIARQILRHRSFSFQEFSQRYALANLGFEYREARLQDTKNRQNSLPLPDDSEDSTNLKTQWLEKQAEAITASRAAYEWAISNGIAKEQARVVLPEGNTTSRLYMTGSLRSWIHYLQLRCANGTQKEHSEVAHNCVKVIAEIFPLITKIVEQTENKSI
jgi:thymidylate synthase (FAD)